MRRIASVLVVLGLVGAACAPETEDIQELRRALNRSELAARAFAFAEVSEQRVFSVTGAVEDDFRYRMTLTTGGSELMEQVVSDDALAIRLLRPETADAYGNALGHPDVDAALREGRWVVDPSGAPSVTATELGEQTGLAGDPFIAALSSLEFVRAATSEASQVREFNLESIEYRPALDPWRYPDEDEGETRYDLIRPTLPQSEDQILGAQGDVRESHFRKTSVFVEDDRVTQVCSVVDVEGHEEFVELKEAGAGGGNPFHRQLLRRIRAGDTTTPIIEQEHFVRFDYERVPSIELPAEAHIGKLTDFKTALEQAFTGGFLRPATRPRELTACDRREAAADS